MSTTGCAYAIFTFMEVTDSDTINIRSVIEHQLVAFKKDDAQGAFAFASPANSGAVRKPRKFYTDGKDKLPGSIPSSFCFF